MAKKKSQTEAAMQSMRERKQQELEARLQRVRKARSTYQRKIIGGIVVAFILLIIVCALLTSGDRAYGTRISMKDRRVFCRVCGTVLNRSCYFLKTAYSYRVYAVFLLEGLFA